MPKKVIILSKDVKDKVAIESLIEQNGREIADACHFLIHGDSREKVPLEELLGDGAPVVIGLEPYVDELQLSLNTVEAGAFRGVCYHAHSDSQPYTTPSFITSFHHIAPRTFLLLTEDDNGYTCYLCLSHADQTISLMSTKDGPTLKACSGSSRRANQRRWALVCQRGHDPYAVLRRTIRLALQLTGNLGRPFPDKAPLPNWFNEMGWTSRLLCGQKASFDTIVNAVRNIQEQGFGLGYVVIEEGWQQLAVNPKDRLLRHCLAGFDADEKRFPNGLRSIVDALRDLGINQVGVWHTFMGSRNGIHPDIARNYSLPPDEYGRFFLGYDLGKTFEFYCDYYGYLRQQGITFVQVGDQLSSSTFCRPGMDVTMLHHNIQVALQGAASTHFTTPHLNSDCLDSRNLFYWPNSIAARTDDDIDHSNSVGIRRSVRNNLSNGLWLQQLMLPDFDSWRTDGDSSEILATLHALSGSLLRIGDGPSHTHAAMLRKVVLPSGKIMKADKPLTLCRDSIFCNPMEEKQAYKAFTFKGNVGVAATFNLCTRQRTVHGTIGASDIEGLAGEQFAVFSHRHGLVGVMDREATIAITLKPKESDVFCFVPIISGIAVLGCHSFFLAPGPITEVVIEQESVHIGSLIAAPLLLYCEREVLEVRRNDDVVPWGYDSKRHLLSLDTRLHIEEIPSVYSITFES